jgi:hypothetical protein
MVQRDAVKCFPLKGCRLEEFFCAHFFMRIFYGARIPIRVRSGCTIRLPNKQIFS